MTRRIRLKPVRRSRLADVDAANLGFGTVYSDHMFSMVYRDGAWCDPEIVPYGPISIEPAACALHYGQAVFEGLKAFRGIDGRIRLFRPDRNLARLVRSCERLCIPPPDGGIFHEAIRGLVVVDEAWIPRGEGEALYIRPLIFSDEPQLEVRPSTHYRFLIMTSPVRNYYGGAFTTVALRAERHYTRAAPGGLGEAKTGGNYAASLLPGERARAGGFHQVLWLDAAEHHYVEEVGQMNIFFRFRDRVVTPPLSGTILPGVTRESVIALLADRGIPLEERRIALVEVADGARSGELLEAFGAGTAAVISPVGRIAWDDTVMEINDNRAGELARELHDEITGLQTGRVQDRHGWTVTIAPQAERPAERESTGDAARGVR